MLIIYLHNTYLYNISISITHTAIAFPMLYITYTYMYIGDKCTDLKFDNPFSRLVQRKSVF